MDSVFAAHRASVFRDNPSTLALKLAAAGSGDYCKSLTAALSTLGEVHGPIEQTVIFLSHAQPQEVAKAELLAGRKVPGWGSSFSKGKKDPLWDRVDWQLQDKFNELYAKLEAVTETLHAVGKVVYPNPSAYTAATAIALRLPAKIAPWIFVRGRLDGWSELLSGKDVWA